MRRAIVVSLPIGLETARPSAYAHTGAQTPTSSVNTIELKTKLDEAATGARSTATATRFGSTR